MSKNERRRGPKKNISRVKNEQARKEHHLSQIENHEKIKKLHSIGIAFSLLTIVLNLLIYSVYSRIAPNKLPEGVEEKLFIVLFILVILRFNLIWPAIKLSNSVDPKVFLLQRRIVIFRNILSVLILTVTILPVIFMSGISSILSRFLSLQFPLISARLVTVITNALSLLFSSIWGFIGNIILGVLGNYLYDILKNHRRWKTRVNRKRRYKR